MSRLARTAQLACLGFALSACDGDDDGLGRSDATPEDAGPGETGASDAGDAGASDASDAADVGPTEDTGPDSGPLPNDFGRLFGTCTSDEDCAAQGGICRTEEEGFPGGYCTKPCDGFNDRTACELTNGDFTVYHHCFDRGEAPEGQTTCEFNCLNGLDCGREAYTCQVNALPLGGLCIPVCSSDEDCRWGTNCNLYTGECQERPYRDPATLGFSVTGDPCDEADDCASGECVGPGTSEQPSGWAEGYCIANCILPSGFNNNNFYVGDALPPGTCPGENPVCVPRSAQSNSRQDLGICFHGCTTDNDCRQGYECARQFDGKFFDNGYCVPGNCQAADVTCPDGYSCVEVQVQGGTRNVCAPN